MNIIIDKNSNIQNIEFDKHVNFIHDKGDEEIQVLIDKVKKGRCDFSNLTVIGYNNKIKYFINPRAPHDDIYIVQNNDGLILYTTIFKNAINFADNLKFNSETEKFFLLNSVCPPSKTFFDEIKRLEPGSIIDCSNSFNIEYIQNTCKKDNVIDVSYEKFKSEFESYIKSHVSGKNIAVLLSGGLDSTSIAIAVKKYALSLRAYTMDYIPKMRGVEDDLNTAIETARYLNIPIEICKIDFNKYSLTDYEKYIDIMPMAVGLVPGFDLTLKKIAENNINLIATGQNADWLYWLSATSKFSFTRAGFASVFRRLFLNEEYFKFILYKEGKNSLCFFLVVIYSVIEWIASLTYSLFKRKFFLPPSNASELIHAFNARPDVVIFIAKEERSKVLIFDFTFPKDIYQELMSIVIKKNMMLPDSQIIRRAADIRNVDVLFPFSSESLMNIWMNKVPKLNEIFEHKKLINKYVSDNYPEYKYKKNKSVGINIDKGNEEQKWAQIVLQNNITLKEIFSNNRNNIGEELTDYRRLIYSIAHLWLEKVKKYRKSV